MFAPYDRGGLAVVIDGLGHGDDAADASAIAERVIREHASDRAGGAARALPRGAAQAAAAWC